MSILLTFEQLVPVVVYYRARRREVSDVLILPLLEDPGLIRNVVIDSR